MTSTTPSDTPAGWYPDPAGERRWRVWTGDHWSELTRPYGPERPVPSSIDNLELVKALYRLIRYGIVALFTGLGVVVSVLAHWPGTAHPVTRAFAAIAMDTGLSLLVLGTACFAFGAKELEGRWTVWAVIPGVNLIGFNVLVTQQLGGRPLQRVGAETLLLALFIARFHVQPWLCIAPAIAAVGQLGWTKSLLDKLSTSASSTPPVAP